jgi:RHS repeat-associated protein
LAEEHTSAADGTVSVLTWDYDPGTFRPAAQRRRTWATAADQEDIDEAFHAIVTDLVGAPTELVTPDGRIAWQTTTTVWGQTTATTTEDDLGCPLRFPGQYHDPETGLYYNLHRYYNPETGAYLTPDPLGLAPAPNDHAYVPNPLTWTDPLGLQCGEGGGSEPDLFHGTDLDSARDIVANGLNQHAARARGGGDVFWVTTSREYAEVFAASNPVMSNSFGLVGIRLRGGLEAGIRSGLLQGDPELPGAYTVSDWEGLNDIATFDLVTSTEG